MGMLASLLKGFITSEPILSVSRRLRLLGKIVVLMYHEVLEDSEEIEAWTVVKKTEYYRQMEYLRRTFTVVSLGSALQMMRKPEALPRNIAVVTFDDGYLGNLECVLHIVEKLEIPITVFVATEAIEQQELYWYDKVIMALQSKAARPLEIDLTQFEIGKYMFPAKLYGEARWNRIQRLLAGMKRLSPNSRNEATTSVLGQIGETETTAHRTLKPLSPDGLAKMSMSPLVSIGAHSHCHNILTQLDKEQVKESVRKSKRLLERWTGRSVGYFAYPNGNYDSSVARIVEDAGFECSVTTVSRAWAKKDLPFALPRIAVGRYDSFDFFKAKVSGLAH